MDKRIHLFLIPIIALAAIPLCAAHSTNSQDVHSKQRRLFSNNDNWPLSNGDESSSDGTVYDDAENRNNARLKSLEEIVRSRQRQLIMDSSFSGDTNENSYSPHYDADSELESSLPYGIQNVMDGTRARVSRSHRVLTSVCPSVLKRIPLNEDAEYEYDPDHYYEVKCDGETVDNRYFSTAEVFWTAGFTCIQRNRTILLRRRERRPLGLWHIHSKSGVPACCECMGPNLQIQN